jgi:hypothetical protein
MSYTTCKTLVYYSITRHPMTWQATSPALIGGGGSLFFESGGEDDVPGPRGVLDDAAAGEPAVQLGGGRGAGPAGLQAGQPGRREHDAAGLAPLPLLLPAGGRARQILLATSQDAVSLKTGCFKLRVDDAASNICQTLAGGARPGPHQRPAHARLRRGGRQGGWGGGRGAAAAATAADGGALSQETMIHRVVNDARHGIGCHLTQITRA